MQDARPIFVAPDAEPAAANTPAQASAKTVPSDEGFASIPASLSPDFSASQAIQPPTPTVPGAFGVVDSSAVPTFSFIEDARPLFSGSLPGPVPADLQSGPQSSNPFASPLDLDAPQLPGAVTHEPDFRAPASHNPNSASSARCFECCSCSRSRRRPAGVAGRSRPLVVFLRRGGDSPRFSDSA